MLCLPIFCLFFCVFALRAVFGRRRAVRGANLKNKKVGACIWCLPLVCFSFCVFALCVVFGGRLAVRGANLKIQPPPPLSKARTLKVLLSPRGLQGYLKGGLKGGLQGTLTGGLKGGLKGGLGGA